MNKLDVYNPNKFFHHKDALIGIAERKIVPPVNFQVDLTNKCNNKCRWCFYDVNPLPEMSREDYISEEKMIEVLYDFKELGGKSIEWTGGGAPTLSLCFRNVVAEAGGIGFGQALVTNGKRLSGEVAEAVKDFDWVRVSLNSSTAETYHIEHGNDFFLRVVNNINEFAKIKDKNCVLAVSMIVDEYNYKEIVDMTLLVKLMNADQCRISFPQTPKNETIFNGIWDDILEQLKEAKLYQDNNFAVFTNEDRINTLAHKTKSKRCYFHHLVPSLGANGVVYPCCHFKYLPEYNLGNVNETSLKDVWYGEKRKQFIDTIGENCKTSCWFNGKNQLADYIVKRPEDVPHVEYP